jgi:hypothetical protein
MAINTGLLTGTGAYVPVIIGGVTRYVPQDQIPAAIGTYDLNNPQPTGPATTIGSTIGGGAMSQMGAIGSVLAATGATETAVGKATIDRMTNQADRAACNQAGGFTTQGGECLTGDVALQRIDEILSNPNAPSVLVDKANKYIERNDDDSDGTVSSEEAADIDPDYGGTPDDVEQTYLEEFCEENPDDIDCQGIGDDEPDPNGTTVVTSDEIAGVLDVIFGPGGIFGDGGIFGGTVFTPTPTGPEGPPTGPEGPPTGPEGPPTGPEGPPTGPEGPPTGPEGPPTGPEGPPTGPEGPPTGPEGPPTGPEGPPTGPEGPPTGPEGPPTGPEGPPTGPEGPPTGPEGPPTGPEGPPSNGPNITDLLTGGAVVAGLGAGGRSRGKSMFQPFMTGLSYQPYQLTPLSFQQRDYAQELTGIIQRNSRGMLT